MNKNVEYKSVPVYNRRMVRNIMRHRIINNNGYHNVNETLHKTFEDYKNTRN